MFGFASAGFGEVGSGLAVRTVHTPAPLTILPHSRSVPLCKVTLVPSPLIVAVVLVFTKCPNHQHVVGVGFTISSCTSTCLRLAKSWMPRCTFVTPVMLLLRSQIAKLRWPFCADW